MNFTFGREQRVAALILLAVASAVVLAIVPPIHQPQSYHHFADGRSWLGIPNFGNVMTNLPFLVVGVPGLWFTFRRGDKFTDKAEGLAYAIFFAGVLLTAFGSAYYHWRPDDKSLVWDRLPMTFGFMGLLTAVISERISTAVGQQFLLPLAVAGIGSIFYWSATGDLRPYVLVQFFPILALPLLLLWFQGRYTRDTDFWWVIGWYGLAKVCELLDKQIFALGGFVSGHSLKHLAAAVSTYCVWRMLSLREVLAPPLARPATAMH